MKSTDALLISVAIAAMFAQASLYSFAQTNSVESVDFVCPAALAPAYREFVAKCEAGKATRGDLIALKKFIAESAVDGAAKTNLTRQARSTYQKSKKGKKKVEVGG